MNVTTERLDKVKVAVTIEVDQDRFDAAVMDAYKSMAPKINVDGFRKGHAPKAVIEKVYGAEIFYEEAVNMLIPRVYIDVMKEHQEEVQPIAKPDFEIVQLEKGKPFIFKATVDTKQEIALGEYKGLEIEKIEEAVTEEDMNQYLDDMRSKHAQIEEVTDPEATVANGDMVTLDFCGKKDGVAFPGGTAEGYALGIGSHSFIPGFEEQMIGMTKGETKDLNLTFPENYPAEELAGAAVVFKVTVHEIAKKVKAELNDEFIASLNIPEVTTVEDFRGYTRAYLEDQAERKFTTEKENAVLDLLIANCEVELDDEDIQKALESHISHIEMDVQSQGFTLDQYLQMMGMSREAFEDQLKEPAKQQAKFEAIIDEIIRVENIETTDEEVDAQAEAIANHNGIQKEDVLTRIPADSFKRDINRVKASQVILTTAKFIVE